MRYLLGLLLLGACGFEVHGAATPCGDRVVDLGEDCDDGDRDPDAVCDATCHFTCGNGNLEVTVGELCDPAIASGPGACPESCEDGDACTSDVLAGSQCGAQCVNDPITGVADGDGCCPPGATANSDGDCAAMCGNGTVEGGETCDTAIASPASGFCPTSCNDAQACTIDTLTGTACTAACTFTPITMRIDNDGCCPSNANANNDRDCSATCGNGAVENGETCDTAIANGQGACPTSCNDGMACTLDTLLSAGTCDATCSATPITAPSNGDGCCPTGANANNDNDCTPKCGNGVIEGSEQCDDGNMNNGDACRNNCTLPPSAFRFGDLDLRDPHLLAPDPFLIGNPCRDATDSYVATYAYNPAIQLRMITDLSPFDGEYDLSPTLVFRPLAQGNGTMTTIELHFASCSGANPISCSAGGTPIAMTATSRTTGACLGILAGTERPYTPPIDEAAGTCFVTAPTAMKLELAGITWNLTDAQLAAVYSGTPATNLVDGVIRGFLSVATANATSVPNSVPLFGGHRLSYALPGGDPAGNDINCAAYSDLDMNNGEPGWWVYFNFTAPRASWTGP